LLARCCGTGRSAASGWRRALSALSRCCSSSPRSLIGASSSSAVVGRIVACLAISCKSPRAFLPAMRPVFIVALRSRQRVIPTNAAMTRAVYRLVAHCGLWNACRRGRSPRKTRKASRPHQLRLWSYHCGSRLALMLRFALGALGLVSGRLGTRGAGRGSSRRFRPAARAQHVGVVTQAEANEIDGHRCKRPTGG
jgi:hypothetical protein